MGADDLVEIDYDEIKELANSWLVTIDDRKVVLPFSCCELDALDTTHPGSILVPEWLSIKEGLV